MLKLPNVAQQNCLFPNKEITFLAGCELHIQTLAFLIILTLKQYITAKTSEVRNINCHDHMRPQSQLTLEVFPGKWIVF